MANSFVKIYVHIIFHVKSKEYVMRTGDLPRIYA